MSEEKLNQCLKENNFLEAIVHCDELISQGDKGASTLSVKGWCLHKSGQSELAKNIILDAFYLEPFKPQVATISLSFFMEMADYEAVVKLCQRCIAFHGGDRLMWHRLGTSHYLLGEIESAVMAFRRSLEIEYTAASAFGLSLPLLCMGLYEEGFSLYEQRFVPHPRINWIQSEKLPMPKWDGESLKGKVILVWSEQGLGDTIQFSRLLTTLAYQGAKVDLMLQPQHEALLDVISTIDGINQVVVVKGNTVSLPYRYDFHCPMMSLMGCLNLRENNIPEVTLPYIAVPSSYQGIPFESKQASGLKVGLVWTTMLTNVLLNENPMHYAEKDKKSIPIEVIESLLALPNITFFILQVSLSTEEKMILSKYNAIDMSEDIKSFTDTAAIINDMDMVISIDTSVVHLAGAMGKPTLNLLPSVSDWRWLKNREDSPWYPTMRLCKQAWRHDWGELVSRASHIVSHTSAHFKKTGEVKINF